MGYYLMVIRDELKPGKEQPLPVFNDVPLPAPPAPMEPVDAMEVEPTLASAEPAVEEEEEIWIDEDGARVIYIPNFLPKEAADALFALQHAETPWETEVLERFGKKVETPRRVYAYSDPDVEYKYIGLKRVGAAWTPVMRTLKERVEERTGRAFNYAFANAYEDGQHTIGWHSDDEKALIANHVIAAVSLGAARSFQFKKKATGEILTKVLKSGSLLIMAGKTQQLYKHRLPRRKTCTSPRINYTFRQVKVEGEKNV